MTAPLLLDVKENALDDGPGIRTVIFLKGCALSCAWCHNPESMQRTAELAWDATTCLSCERCHASCPEAALGPGPERVDRRRCTSCFDCVDVCPSGALTQVGRETSIEGLVDRVVRDRPFFQASGGGVTISGGEPTLDLDWLADLVAALRAEEVPVLLQTCGTFAMQRFEDRVHPHLDDIHFDLKLADDDAHRRWCGASNQGIHANLARLLELERQGGARVLPRVPLVPGITDTQDNLVGLAELLVAVGARRVQLVPYNPLWPDKLPRIGARARIAIEGSWMAADTVHRCEQVFLSRGLVVVHGVQLEDTAGRA